MHGDTEDDDDGHDSDEDDSEDNDELTYFLLNKQLAYHKIITTGFTVVDPDISKIGGQ